MKSRGLKKESIKANWEPFARRPTWSCVSSRELSVALCVSLQSICNWRLRGILPEPEPHSRQLNGNKNYYRISKIRSWLEDRPEDEIHWEFIKQHMDTGTPYSSLEQAEDTARICYKIFDIEKPLIPGIFKQQAQNMAVAQGQSAASP